VSDELSLILTNACCEVQQAFVFYVLEHVLSKICRKIWHKTE